MTRYIVFAKDYYFDIHEDITTTSEEAYAPGGVNVFMVEEAMNGLIQRHSLFNNKILSLGSGDAFEEYWFHKAGCQLFLNDLDFPNNKIEKRLKSLPQAQTLNFVYDIQDADITLNQLPLGYFDTLYVSGFHPDEIRRELIQEQFKALRSNRQARRMITWPNDVPPYSATLVNAISKLRPGGLLIFQHYRGGVYIDTNPHYLKAIQNQFRQHGAELVEAYSFRKSPPHLLVVGLLGTKSQAITYARDVLSMRPAIHTFHGRYPDDEIKRDVVKVFDISNSKLSPAKAFKNQNPVQGDLKVSTKD